jgi:hypothetical protein
MALKLNNQPKNPSGPVLDSNKYMTKPTTTDGKAKKVFNTVRTNPLPVNLETPKKAPKEIPTTQPIKQAVVLTPNERPATAQSPGSRDVMSAMAVVALSKKVFIRTKLSADANVFK